MEAVFNAGCRDFDAISFDNCDGGPLLACEEEGLDGKGPPGPGFFPISSLTPQQPPATPANILMLLTIVHLMKLSRK
jgi:hypothetical protein